MIRRRRIKWLLFASLACAILVGFVMLAILADEVVRKVRLLETARSDNVQWTLSQAEVEFLEFWQALEEASDAPEPDLSKVRLEFDVFYSRVQTISRGLLYQELSGDPRYVQSVATFRQFLDDTVPLIDGSDAALADQLATLAGELGGLRPAMRDISLLGLETFAAESDTRRQEVAQTLTRLGATTLGLLTILLFAAVVLLLLYRLSESRATKLQTTTRQLHTMVETSLDAILVADQKGRILAFNAAAESIFGRNRSEAIGKDMADLIVPEKYRAAHRAGMERHRKTGEKRVIGAGRIRLEALKADGTLFPVELAIQSAERAGGEVFVSFLRDISHRVAAEQELIEARDKAVAGERAKSEFLAVMSHELRTPLNGLLGTLSLLKDTTLDPGQRRLVGNMAASGALLLNHANDVLDISKYEAGKLEIRAVPTSLDTVVEDVVHAQRDLAYANQNSLNWHWTGPPLGPIVSDPDRLKQILVNLVGNAVKFTRSGRITVELVATGPRSQSGVEIRVHDTGLGVPAPDIERIFEDFETGDASYGRVAEGTGLGLGIARRLARALGGEIGVKSEVGVGSTFWLRLPAVPAPAHAVVGGSSGPDERPEQCPPLRVLVVEDNAINREVLVSMLQADGHHVVEAHDGHEGVRIAGEQSFDLILMDIRMPHLDGFSAAERIRSDPGLSQSTRILAVTAQALPEEIEAVMAGGFDGYLTKPIDRAALRDALLSVAGTILHPGSSEESCIDDARADPHGWALGAEDWVEEEHILQVLEAVGEDATARLLLRFITEEDHLEGTLAEIGSEEYPSTELAERVHKAAGSAGTFGCVALKTLLNSLERDLRRGAEPGVIQEHVQLHAQVWEKTRTHLQSLVPVSE